jgi:hypothetical protein
LGSLDDNYKQKRQKQWWRITQNGEEGTKFLNGTNLQQNKEKWQDSGYVPTTMLFFFLYSLCSRYSLDGIYT